ncbi:hypothetical protein ABZS76_28905 [Streptomyces sp. NPDC005562]|uniref:hypothetical protein n=1 Tax=unclassified Streptomyces TaxID=2593676 RepID=UPI0033B5FCCC
MRLDIPGALLASGGLVAIVYASSDAESAGWADPLVLPLFAAGVALLAVFVWWQSHAKHPMLPLHIVRDRTRAAALATMGLATVAMFGAFLFLRASRFRPYGVRIRLHVLPPGDVSLNEVSAAELRAYVVSQSPPSPSDWGIHHRPSHSIPTRTTCRRRGGRAGRKGRRAIDSLLAGRV